MPEQPQVLAHRFRVEDGVDRRVDLVLQRENIPPNFAVGELQHPSVQPSKDVRSVKLSISRPNRSFEATRQLVALKVIRWLPQVRSTVESLSVEVPAHKY